MHFRVMDGDSGPSVPPALLVGDADAPQKQRSLMERPAADRLVFFCLVRFCLVQKSAWRLAGGPWLNSIAKARAAAVIWAYRSPKTLTSGLPERRRALPYQSSR